MSHTHKNSFLAFRIYEWFLDIYTIDSKTLVNSFQAQTHIKPWNNKHSCQSKIKVTLNCLKMITQAKTGNLSTI